MSAYEKTGSWKSPRKIEEEIRDYQRDRFEGYMQMVDRGAMNRPLALTALREELDNIALINDKGEFECPTVSIDSTKLQEMLDE